MAAKLPDRTPEAQGSGADAQPPEDRPMTVFEHLDELRVRLIRAVLGTIPGISVAWALREELLAFLVKPLGDAMRHLGHEVPKLHFPNPVDPILVHLRIALYVGLIFSAPWILWQAWMFIAPGLYEREKKLVLPFILASAFFFIGGAFFGYAFVFPLAFEMLLGIDIVPATSAVALEPTIMIDEYLAFSTRMLLAFGVVFEVPVVVTGLAAAQVVNWKQLLAFSRWWVLTASVLAALLTPPDVLSMLLMLVPLVTLYFASVGVAYFIGPTPPETPEPPEAPTDAGVGSG
jgi:sec-independent protein translocase protein TatC